ncbi:MAG: hypothetical protein GY862_18345 [Gammaproteobacteria bacterium]|nr:hypothetical protein [Gammaproteobacteria bacterium]
MLYVAYCHIQAGILSLTDCRLFNKGAVGALIYLLAYDESTTIAGYVSDLGMAFFKR